MRVRIRWTVLVCLALLFVAAVPFAAPALTPAVQAQDKTLVWQNFDVDLRVNSDGTFTVEEHQTIRFTSGSFTAGYRDITINNFSFIDEWALTDDAGNVYSQANSGGTPYTFLIEENSRNYVMRWYFPPTANTTVTYNLRYTVHDGLRYYDGGDQLWWKAIFSDRSFPVLDGQVRVVMPQAASIQEWAAYINGADARDSASAALIEGGQAVTFDLDRRLDPGEEFEVRVEFTPNVVDGTKQP